jgi:hypothetical protein
VLKLRNKIFFFRKHKFNSTCLLFLVFFPHSPLFAQIEGEISFGKKIVNKIDKKQTEWVRSYTNQFEKEICGQDFPELSYEGLHIIKKKAERITNRCYSADQLPSGIGIDFSSIQSNAEEVFFDSLIRTKLDHLTCREAAIECLNKGDQANSIAADFVDRLNAFRVYRDKYKAFNSSAKKEVFFTKEESRILSKYFPDSTNSPERFFKEWQPVTAMALLVNYMDPSNDQSFVFQEAFASLAEDENALNEFGKMNQQNQIRAIADYIKQSSESQKKAINEERSYWERHCTSKDPNCFFRPIFEQKRKLIEEFITNTAYDPSQWNSSHNKKFNKPSKEEMAFACALQLKYGKGAQYFDNQMNNMSVALAVVPIVSRPIAGVFASRNLTAKVMGDKIVNSRLYQHSIKSAGAGLKASGKLAFGSQMFNLYESCESGEFEVKPKLPFAPTKEKKPQKNRDEFLADCKKCRRQPSTKKLVNYSCLKEATNWALSRSVGFFKSASKMSTVEKASNDSTETAFLPEKLDQLSETFSLYLKNQALITTFDVPSISNFSDESSNDNK